MFSLQKICFLLIFKIFLYIGITIENGSVPILSKCIWHPCFLVSSFKNNTGTKKTFIGLYRLYVLLLYTFNSVGIICLAFYCIFWWKYIIYIEDNEQNLWIYRARALTICPTGLTNNLWDVILTACLHAPITHIYISVYLR